MGRGEAGSRAALPIWVDYMREALKDVPMDKQDLPAYIEAGFVDRNTGQRTDEADPTATPEYFALEPLDPYLIAANLLREQFPDPEHPNHQYVRLLEESASTTTTIEQPLDLDAESNGSNADRITEAEQETEGLF